MTTSPPITSTPLRRVVTAVLLALAVLIGAPALSAALSTDAPASAFTSCATDLPTQIAAWKTAGQQYNSEVAAINAAGGGSPAQVATYNARKAQLQAQGAALIAQVQACVATGQKNVPPVPQIPGLTPGGTPGQPGNSPDSPRGPPNRTAPTRPTTPATPATPAQTPSTPAPAQPAPARPQPKDAPVAPSKPTAPTKPGGPKDPETPSKTADPTPAPARSTPPVAKAAPAEKPAPAPKPSQPTPAQKPAPKPDPAPKPADPTSTPSTPGKPEQSAEPQDYGSTPQERLNNPAFVKRFYKAPSPDGTLQRKDQYATDDFGNPIPKARIGADGKPILVEDRIDTYATLGPREQAAANDNARSTIDPIATERAEAIAALNDLRKQADREIAEQGDITADTANKLATAHTQVRDLGEKLGLEVARDRVHQMYGEQYDIRPLTDSTKPSGPGEADQVYLLTPKNGGPSKTVLVEAKGVNADLGSKIVNGERVQQGTREYVEDLANSDRESEAVRGRLRKGLSDGSLTYLVIRPTVDSSGRWTGSVVQQFNIDK